MLAFFIATSLFGCAVESAPVHVRDGKEYGVTKEIFRERWWNFYERGLSFAEGEFYKEAERDLKEAMGQRDKDQRMARTYGMHFVDYFPHRELGIVYYETGDMEKAGEELELSLRQFPSAKARFYLDRVRQSLVRKRGESVPRPRLTLDVEKNEIWTRDDPVVISGIAKDENYVSEVSLGGTRLFSEGSEKEFSFEESLRLPQGRHEIAIRARNLAGKTSEQTLIIHADREGPIITVEDFRTEHSGVSISGSVYDEAGVSELRLNGQPLDIRKDIEIFFEQTLSLEAETLELSAQDRLGNRTSAKLSRGLRVAGCRSQVAGRQKPETRNQKPAGLLLASAASHTTPLFLASLFGPKDDIPPDIRLKGWTEEQSVFLEKIYVEGKVGDDSKIIRLGVNGTPVLRREGKHIFFGHLVELREGKNEIRVQAEDEAGNVSEKKILVNRKIPRALHLGERLSLSVFPFDQSGDISEFSLSFQDNLITSLVNRNRFQVVERDKLELLLREQKLGASELADPETALKLGRMVAAHSIITGRIVESRKGVEIVARMIDTETAEVLASKDVYDETKDIVALKTLSEGMALKFHREFPLLNGLVLQQKGDFIFIDLGQEKVRLRRRFITYREEPVTHPLTGKVLGADNVITGHVRITQTSPELSKARILDDDAAIRPMDKVIAE